MANERPSAAPARFPYTEHRTLAEVWGIPARAPAAAKPVRKPLPRVTPAERLDMISAEKAFERFTRGDW